MGGGGDTERGEGRARERGRGPRGRGGGQGGVRWEASSLSEWPHPASTHRCGLAQVGRVPLPPLPQSTHHHTLSTPLHTQPAAPCSSARGSTLGGGSPPPSHTYSTNTSPPPPAYTGPHPRVAAQLCPLHPTPSPPHPPTTYQAARHSTGSSPSSTPAPPLHTGSCRQEHPGRGQVRYQALQAGATVEPSEPRGRGRGGHPLHWLARAQGDTPSPLPPSLPPSLKTGVCQGCAAHG